MSSAILSQVILNTITLAFLYCLMCIGLTLIFGIVRIVHFAHGQVYMLGAYAVYYIFEGLQINYAVSLIASAVIMALVGIVLERVFLRPLRKEEFATLLMGIGLLLLLEGGALLVFGEKAKYISAVMPGTSQVFGAQLSNIRLLIVGVAFLLLVFLFVFLKWVRIGQAMRAVAQDAEGALLQGISDTRMIALAMGIGSGMAALAGGLLLPFTALSPFIGGPMIFKAFFIVILGGLGSIPGAVLGAFTVAAIESIGYTFWGSGTPLIYFAMVMLVLMFRPRGFLGHE
jgi:branched-chain amino acid transport system permease protein